jgi:hypothetical protein
VTPPVVDPSAPKCKAAPLGKPRRAAEIFAICMSDRMPPACAPAGAGDDDQRLFVDGAPMAMVIFFRRPSPSSRPERVVHGADDDQRIELSFRAEDGVARATRCG